MVKGYKILGINMEAAFGNKMVYELEKDYNITERIECGKCGYHYFETLTDCIRFITLKFYRVFECELNGDKFRHYGNIHCTNHIRITREISQDEIKQYILDNLDKFMNGDSTIRRQVAEYGFNLEILQNDKDWFVRRTAKRQLELNK